MHKPSYINPQRHEQLSTFEDALQEMSRDGAELSTVRFPDPQTARAAYGQFAYRTADILGDLTVRSDTDVEFSGEGVRVPAVTAEHFSDGRRLGIFIGVPVEEAFRPLNEVESMQGRIDGASVTMHQHDDGFQLVPHLTFASSAKEEASIALTENFNLIDVLIGSRGLARLDGQTRMAITGLERIRAVYRVKDAMTEHHLLNTPFNAEARRLEEAMQHRVKHDFVELRKPEIINNLGVLAGELSRKGEPYRQIVNDRILNIVGHESTLRVIYEGESELPGIAENHRLSGRLVGIETLSAPEDPVDPSFVLSITQRDSGRDQAVIVPFTSIKSMSF